MRSLNDGVRCKSVGFSSFEIDSEQHPKRMLIIIECWLLHNNCYEIVCFPLRGHRAAVRHALSIACFRFMMFKRHFGMQWRWSVFTIDELQLHALRTANSLFHGDFNGKWILLMALRIFLAFKGKHDGNYAATGQSQANALP